MRTVIGFSSKAPSPLHFIPTTAETRAKAAFVPNLVRPAGYETPAPRKSLTEQRAVSHRAAGEVTPIRNWRERAIQTILLELGGLVIIGPLWRLATGSSATQSVLVLACLSVAVILWTAVYNTVFDFAESRVAGRIASDRPHHWRAVHAVGQEVTATVVTCPLLIIAFGFGLLEALAAEIALTIAYAIYGYFFHLGFDRLRPVVGPIRIR